MPAEIGSLSNLRTLDLNSNGLSSVPAEIGNLSNLRALDLSSNQLSSMSAEIGNLSNGTFVGLYDDFTLGGPYRFVIYGQAGEDDLLMPTVLEMEFEGEVGPPSDDAFILSQHRVYLPMISR